MPGFPIDSHICLLYDVQMVILHGVGLGSGKGEGGQSKGTVGIRVVFSTWEPLS